MSDRLPGVLGEMVEAVGVAPALKFAEWRGGVRIYVPIAPISAEHEISKRIGHRAATWLAETYGLDYVKVPRAVRYLREMLEAEIVARYRTEPAHKLALEYQMDERSVWRIVARNRHRHHVPDRQVGLL